MIKVWNHTYHAQSSEGLRADLKHFKSGVTILPSPGVGFDKASLIECTDSNAAIRLWLYRPIAKNHYISVTGAVATGYLSYSLCIYSVSQKSTPP